MNTQGWDNIIEVGFGASLTDRHLANALDAASSRVSRAVTQGTDFRYLRRVRLQTELHVW
jgi:hypothetical protein